MLFLPKRLLFCLVLLTVFALSVNLALRFVAFPVSLPQVKTPPVRPALSSLLVVRLVAGREVEERLARGQIHEYPVHLRTGQYLQFVAEQKNIDIRLTLLAPDGRLIFKVDSDDGAAGPEDISWVGEEEGLHRVRIQAAPEAFGVYGVRIKPLRHAGSRDRTQATAMKAFYQAKALPSESAIPKFREAARLWKALGDQQRQGNALFHLGRRYRGQDVDAAIKHFSAALDLYRAAGAKREEVRSLNELAAIHYELGELQSARPKLEQALELAREIHDPWGEAGALSNLGSIYLLKNENWKALSCFEEALPLWGALGNRIEKANLLNNIGLIYSSAGDPQRALDYLREGLELLGTDGSDDLRAMTETRIAEAYQQIGNQNRALDGFQKALELRRKAANRHGEAVTLVGMGLSYRKSGLYRQAFDFYRRALKIFQSLGERANEGMVWSHLGFLSIETEEPLKALDSFEHALALAEGLPGRTARSVTLFGMAKAERLRRNPIQALARIQEAVAEVESLRNDTVRRDLQISFLASKQDFYSLLIDLLMGPTKGNPPEEDVVAALETSEQARARGLLDGLSEGVRKGLARRLSEPLRQSMQQLEGEIDATSAEAERLERDGEPRAAMDRAMRGLRDRFYRLEEQARQRDPLYGALTQRKKFALRQFQQEALDEDSILLVYHLADMRSFLWLVSSTSVERFELPGLQEIEAAAFEVHEILSRSPLQTSNAAIQSSLSKLSQLILGQASGRLGKKRLLIVAQGALQYIPFAALPDPVPDSQKAGYPAPLLVNHEIVILPSLSVLAALRERAQRRAPAPGLLAMFAAPVFSAPGAPWASLERLPFSSREAREILSLVAGQKVLRALGLAATRELVLSPELGKYRILHFSTHATVNIKHPEMSAIELSRVDRAGKERDGSLRAYEIYGLDLAADLVVLSACQTALGKDIRGEGLVGLTHAFLYAGATRVIVSLWDVRDAGSAELMARFYRSLLREKRTPAAALRSAQLSMLQDPMWRSPHDWAGFELQGEWQ